MPDRRIVVMTVGMEAFRRKIDIQVITTIVEDRTMGSSITLMQAEGASRALEEMWRKHDQLYEWDEEHAFLVICGDKLREGNGEILLLHMQLYGIPLAGFIFCTDAEGSGLRDCDERGIHISGSTEAQIIQRLKDRVRAVVPRRRAGCSS